MNIIARLEFELAYYDSAVHRFNHYTTRTPPSLQTVKYQTVLFDPLIGPYQVLPIQVRVGLGPMAISKGSPSGCLVSYPGHSLGESYFFAKMPSVFCSPNRLGHLYSEMRRCHHSLHTAILILVAIIYRHNVSAAILSALPAGVDFFFLFFLYFISFLET